MGKLGGSAALFLVLVVTVELGLVAAGAGGALGPAGQPVPAAPAVPEPTPVEHRKTVLKGNTFHVDQRRVVADGDAQTELPRAGSKTDQDFKGRPMPHTTSPCTDWKTLFKHPPTVQGTERRQHACNDNGKLVTVSEIRKSVKLANGVLRTTDIKHRVVRKLPDGWQQDPNLQLFPNNDKSSDTRLALERLHAAKKVMKAYLPATHIINKHKEGIKDPTTFDARP